MLLAGLSRHPLNVVAGTYHLVDAEVDGLGEDMTTVKMSSWLHTAHTGLPESISGVLRVCNPCDDAAIVLALQRLRQIPGGQEVHENEFGQRTSFLDVK